MSVKSSTLAANLPPAVPIDQAQVTRRLNTSDVKSAFDYIVTRGVKPRRIPIDTDFDCLVNAKNWALSFVEGNEYYEQFRTSKPITSVTRSVRKYFDYDADGKVSAADYHKSYVGAMTYMTSKQTTLDYWLPFLGQCAFGMAFGWVLGRVAYRMYQAKLLILIVGGGGYLGLQYLAEQRVIDYDLIRAATERQVRQTMDVNKDGSLNVEDVEALVAERMKVVVDKLGPQVFAPGLVGVATFGLGMLRGFRFI
ncbi:transmembrane protein, putative [Bodo saltans]|uniref:Transmembrane protein, putative n=1 Tax=Bodo saltans TaxID=75058 RepID=A0A0S4IKQ0_BODSA|nr:transmembrane protein, putative [Bodo saltans]|eukprot:CUF12512.1 transmembrane protein, putative [Bodo saltans]